MPNINCVRALSSILALFLVLSSGARALAANEIPLNSLTLNGSATISGSTLQLTDTYSQTGSAFVPTPYSLGPSDTFEVFFAYQMARQGTDPIGDGFAFIAQNTTMGANYLSESDGGLGFFTQTELPAVGVVFFSTRDNLVSANEGYVGILTPNIVSLSGDTPTPSTITGSGANALRYVWVDYDNATKLMAIYYSRTNQKPMYPIEYDAKLDLSKALGGSVYFGFSGGTDGANASLQSIDYQQSLKRRHPLAEYCFRIDH